MVTDDLLQAFGYFVDMIPVREKTRYIWYLEDMLRDYDADEWASMTEKEKKNFINQYLPDDVMKYEI